VTTKVCKKCGAEKSLENFGKNRSARDGLINNCKPCEVKRVAEWSKSNPAKVKAWADKNREKNLGATLPLGTKRMCRKCKEEKLLSEFHANPRDKHNVRKICKACTAVHMAKKYAANPEKERAKTAKWRSENPDKDREYNIKYHQDNKKELNEYRRQFRLKNIEREKEKDRRYLKNNRAKVYAKNARRRAARTEATPLWLTAIQKAQIDEFYEIALAKTMQTGIPQEVDHIVPLLGEGVRGLHVPWNLQILTEFENCSKHNKLLEVGS
jgi:hypothetical protein